MYVKYYQKGKAIGKDEFDGGLGVAFGRTVAFSVSRIDSSGYVKEGTYEGPSLPVLSIHGRYGVSPTLDIGGELFTSLGSSGGKIFGKYMFSELSSDWGIAIMPVLGYASGGVQTSGINFDDEWESELSHGVFIAELPLLVSYHPSTRTAFTFGPRVYYYSLTSKDITKWTGTGISEKHEASKSFVSPAFSFGFQHRGFRSDITLVTV